MHEFVVRDGSLVFLELAPVGFAAERAQVRRRLVRRFLVHRPRGGPGEEEKECQPMGNERAKHQFGIFEFNTMIAPCSRFFSSATWSASPGAARSSLAWRN